MGCAYKDLTKDVKTGDFLLLADGYIVLEVLSVKGTRIECVTRAGGELSNRKGLNRQGGGLSAPALTDKDLEYIQLAAEMGVDWLAVSFARDAADIRRAQSELRKWRGTAHVVAKIERHEAIDNLGEILGVADAVMVARGDLGVEMGYAALDRPAEDHHPAGAGRQSHRHHRHADDGVHDQQPGAHARRGQRRGQCRARRQRRGDAVGRDRGRKISGQGRAGHGRGHRRRRDVSSLAGRSVGRSEGDFSNTEEAIAKAVMYAAGRMHVRAIVALTESGLTPLWMSRIRGDMPIFAFTRQLVTRNRVTLYRGVYPVLYDLSHESSEHIYQAVFDELLERGLVDVGDQIILTKGVLSGVQGGTNSMHILRVHARLSSPAQAGQRAAPRASRPRRRSTSALLRGLEVLDVGQHFLRVTVQLVWRHVVVLGHLAIGIDQVGVARGDGQRCHCGRLSFDSTP